MKPVTLVGIALIVLGVLALAYQGITYTTREKVIDLGPLQASVEKKKSIPLPPVVGARAPVDRRGLPERPPVVGALALAGGVVMVFIGSRRSSA